MAGKYSVRASLRSTSPRRSSTIRDIKPAEIEVRNLVGRPVFEIEIPEESLKQSLERVRGR